MNFQRIFSFTLVASSLMLTACAKEPVGVTVHGVNYTEDEFTYSLHDPKNKKNNAGGESIGAFSAGGIVCCFSVPGEWQPGTKVDIKLKLWLTSRFPELDPDLDKIEKVEERITVDLPRYANGKPGELWVVRNADGSFDLVSSNYEPGHEKWPGKIKGWPAASSNYRQKLIRREIAATEDNIRGSRAAQQEMKNDMNKYAEENWNWLREYRQDEAKAYAGPSDPKFIQYLRTRADQVISTSEAKLSTLKKELN